jgi:hypothetical protein
MKLAFCFPDLLQEDRKYRKKNKEEENKYLQFYFVVKMVIWIWIY